MSPHSTCGEGDLGEGGHAKLMKGFQLVWKSNLPCCQRLRCEEGAAKSEEQAWQTALPVTFSYINKSRASPPFYSAILSAAVQLPGIAVSLLLTSEYIHPIELCRCSRFFDSRKHSWSRRLRYESFVGRVGEKRWNLTDNTAGKIDFMAGFAATSLSLVMPLKLEGNDWSSYVSSPPTAFQTTGLCRHFLNENQKLALLRENLQEGMLWRIYMRFLFPIDTK